MYLWGLNRRGEGVGLLARCWIFSQHSLLHSVYIHLHDVAVSPVRFVGESYLFSVHRNVICGEKRISASVRITVIDGGGGGGLLTTFRPRRKWFFGPVHCLLHAQLMSSDWTDPITYVYRLTLHSLPGLLTNWTVAACRRRSQVPLIRTSVIRKSA